MRRTDGLCQTLPPLDDRDGTVEATGLADAWPAGGPVELWRRPIGSGFSAVVVRGDVAYTMEAVDSQIVDYTQSAQPLRQRAYFSDFREVGGAMIPFRVELEFNARFEGMTVETVTVNPELDASAFSPPEVPAAEPGR
jgi:hypothetical protein